MPVSWGLTDAVLLGMFVLSLLGVLHPVKVKDGLLEALKWGILWLAYRLAARITMDETAKREWLQSIQWLAVIVAIVGWLPWVSKVEGRLSSVFGYSNAAAALLGAALLLNPQSFLVRTFLIISLLGTGSRAGVGLFLTVLGVQRVLVWLTYPGISSILAIFRRLRARSMLKQTVRQLKIPWRISLGVVGMVFVLFFFRAAWRNLTTWGFTSSSWQERLVYFKDGINLAWQAGGYPRAGGWMAFPTVQHVPYWTADPHSSFIHSLLNQGILGILILGCWSCYQLGYAGMSWKGKRLYLQAPSDGLFTEIKAQLSVGTALLFLAVHSLVDADFSFGSLGLLFWVLLGSFQPKEEYPNLNLSKRKFVVILMTGGELGLSLILCWFCLSSLLNPAILDQEKSWNIQASRCLKEDSDKSAALWNKSLHWDQTQINTRRAQAEFLLKQGKVTSGLRAVEDVLYWQPLNLEAYEWAQSIVWDTAERQRNTQRKTAETLYRWVEGVPEKIEEKVNTLTGSERLMWKNYREFLPSEHIKLLAEFARQRQLTQLSLRT